MAHIVLSYRREDTADYARRLIDALRRHFGTTEVVSGKRRSASLHRLIDLLSGSMHAVSASADQSGAGTRVVPTLIERQDGFDLDLLA